MQHSNVTSILAQDAVGARVRDRLTPKEIQIVALITQGCKNKQIAIQLNTKEQVIKNYLRSIYDKTGVSDRLELALITLSKAEIIRAGLNLGVDYGLTSSCYDPAPNGQPCGRCDSCVLRVKGFRDN